MRRNAVFAATRDTITRSKEASVHVVVCVVETAAAAMPRPTARGTPHAAASGKMPDDRHRQQLKEMCLGKRNRTGRSGCCSPTRRLLAHQHAPAHRPGGS